MNTPLDKAIILRMPSVGSDSILPSKAAKITQADGSNFPLYVQRAIIDIDWGTMAPVTVDLKCIGGFAVEAAAGLRNIEINGKTYRLVEVVDMPEGGNP